MPKTTRNIANAKYAKTRKCGQFDLNRHRTGCMQQLRNSTTQITQTLIQKALMTHTQDWYTVRLLKSTPRRHTTFLQAINMNSTLNINETRVKNIAVATFTVMTFAVFNVEAASAQCRISGGNPGYRYNGDDYGFRNRFTGRSGGNFGLSNSRSTNSRFENSYGQTGNRTARYNHGSYNSSKRPGYRSPYYNDTRRSRSYQPSNLFDPKYSQSRPSFSRARF